jgi:CubicO group peptidase (beta-lactamase class C family)
VPAAWLEESFATRVPAEDGLEYGYHWWLGCGQVDGRPGIAGFGNGGQRLVIVPALDLVIAILAGNYNQPDAWKVPVAIISQILLWRCARAERQGAAPDALRSDRRAFGRGHGLC